MKKLFAVLLSALLLCGIVVPAFAKGEVPDKPELVAAEIVSIPEKNKYVEKNGDPEYPDGIVLRLYYSDGSISDEMIIEKTGEFFAGNEKVVYIGKPADVVLYGELTAYLELKNGEIMLSYKFYSPEPDTTPSLRDQIVNAIQRIKIVLDMYFLRPIILFFRNIFQ